MKANGRPAVFALLGLIWGSEWLATQSIESPPLQSLALRYALAFLILAMAAAVLRLPLPQIRNVAAVAITGVALLALPAILTLWAAARVSPGLLVVVLATTPLIAAVAGGAGERTAADNLNRWAGRNNSHCRARTVVCRHAMEGAAAALIAATLVAGSIVYLKRALSRAHPIVLAALQFGAASIVLAGASLLAEGHPSPVWTARRGSAAGGCGYFRERTGLSSLLLAAAANGKATS